MYCTSKCREMVKNYLLRQERELQNAETKRNRRCVQCGMKVPLSRNVNSIYCSEYCNKKNKLEGQMFIRMKEKEGRICQYRKCENEIPPNRKIEALFCGDKCKRKELWQRQKYGMPEQEEMTEEVMLTQVTKEVSQKEAEALMLERYEKLEESVKEFNEKVIKGNFIVKKI